MNAKKDEIRVLVAFYFDRLPVITIVGCQERMP